MFITQNFADPEVFKLVRNQTSPKLTLEIDKSGNLNVKGLVPNQWTKFSLVEANLHSVEDFKDAVQSRFASERQSLLPTDKPKTKPETLVQKDLPTMLSEAGIEFKGGTYRFEVNDVKRSFKATKTFQEALQKLKTTDQVKLAIYQRLLAIITKDGSIHTNKHRVAGGNMEKFRASNETLQKEITHLQEKAKKTKTAPSLTPNQILAETKAAASGTPIATPVTAVETTAGESATTTESTPEAPLPMGPEAPSAGEIAKNAIETKNRELLQAELRGYNDQFNKEFDQYLQEAKANYGKGYEIQQREYIKNKVRKHIQQQVNVDADFGKLTERAIQDKFLESKQYKKVETVLISPPFNYNAERVPAVFADILSRGPNDTITLGDVFEATKENLAATANGLVPTEYFNDYVTFGLRLTEESLKEPRSDVYKNMIAYGLAPLRMFIETAKTLDVEVKHEDIYRRPGENSPGLVIMRKMNERRERIEKLYKGQEKLLQGLFKLASYDDQYVADFEHILALLHGGSKDHITMADIDGNTFTVDEGIFKRYNSPVAVIYDLTNEKGLYKLEGGAKKLDEAALKNYVNDAIKLGFLNTFIEDRSRLESGEVKMAEVLNDPKFNQELNNLYIKDFKNISTDQVQAFQAGYLVKQARKFYNQFEAKDANGEKIVAKNPALQGTIDQLVEKGIKKEDVRRLEDMIMSWSTNAQFKEQADGTYALESATLGLPKMKLSDGTSVNLNLTATRSGDALASLTFAINLVDTKNYSSQILTTIGIGGFAAGYDQTARTDYINFNTFVGASWNWGNIVPTAGGRLVLSWNMQEGMKRSVAEAKDATRYKEIWAKWETIPRDDINARFEVIKSLPTIWNEVQPLMEKFDLQPVDVVQMIENCKENITEKALEEYGTFMLITGVGVAMVGAVPMPIVQIKIGSALVSIPNRKELSRVLPQLSNAVTNDKIDRALGELVEQKHVVTMPKLVYGKDGKLLALVKSSEIFTKLQGSLEATNKQLQEAEVSLDRGPDGLLLNVLNDSVNDVQIYAYGVKVLPGKPPRIQGDTSNLVISRERFKMPFERDEYKASVRDIITIRRREDHEAGIDRQWLEANSPNMLQKLMHQDTYEDMGGRGRVATPESTSTGAAEGFGSVELQRRGKALEKRRAALAKFGLRSVDSDAYEKQELNQGQLLERLDIAFEDAGFRKKLQTVIDDPAKLTKLIAEDFEGEINDREMNMAVIHLQNRHFTELARNRNYTAIRKGLKHRIAWSTPIFRKKFEAGLTKLGHANPKEKARALTKKFMSTMYDNLLNKLRSGDFDYTAEENISDIPNGSDFYSSSRRKEGGKWKRALTKTLDYRKLPKPERRLHEFGFLKDTVKEYDPNSSDPDEKLIAQLLLEESSPLPTDAKEFMASHLALIVAHSELGNVLMSEKSDQLVTEIYEDPTKLSNPEHKAAYEEFHALVTEIREHQLANTPFTKTIGDTTVELKPAKIVAGAYSPCGNASFYIEDLGEVTVTKKGQVVAVFNETIDRIDSTPGKLTAHFLAGISVEKVQKPKPTPTPTKPPTQNPPPPTKPPEMQQYNPQPGVDS